MVYSADHSLVIENGKFLGWLMLGRHNASIPVSLRVSYVKLPNGRKGITLEVATDSRVEVTAFQPENDTTAHHGRVVWLEGMNGVALQFEDDLYPLFRIEDVNDDLGWGKLYFHFLPKYARNAEDWGWIRHSDAMFPQVGDGVKT